jgi:hypothetical protein
VDDPRIYHLYEHAFNLGLIILFHAGIDIGLPEPYHCTPFRLSKLIGDFPGGRFVAAHLGGYRCWDDVEKYLLGKDICLDTSYSIGWMTRERAKDIIMGHGYRKILFGTDSPWSDQSEEIERIKCLNLEDKAEKAILGENARDLLDIDY